jgi:hypothetical protein
MSLLFAPKVLRYNRLDAGMPIGRVIQHEIESAPDYHDGALESMQKQHARLVEIVTMMASLLDEAQQKELADDLCYEERQP